MSEPSVCPPPGTYRIDDPNVPEPKQTRVIVGADGSVALAGAGDLSKVQGQTGPYWTQEWGGVVHVLRFVSNATPPPALRGAHVSSTGINTAGALVPLP